MGEYSDLECEIWKDIKGWSFHQVSNKGRIRVLPGGQVGRWKIASRIELRKLTHDIKGNSGYMRVMQGRTTKHQVHVIVLNEFDGPCPPGLECRHLNGDRTDNRWPENIKWGTHTENMEDRHKQGGYDGINKGESHGSSKLTWSQVNEIKSRPGYWGITKDLGDEFNISHTTIAKIRRGDAWKDNGDIK